MAETMAHKPSDQQTMARKPSKEVLAEGTTVLQSCLLDAIRLQSSEHADKVQKLIAMSSEAGSTASSMQELSAYIDTLSPTDLCQAAAAFNMMLMLENIAEDVATRIRSDELAQEGFDPLTMKTASSMKMLLQGGEWGKPRSPEAVAEALQQIHLDIVFTAHPTQVMRKGLLRKCQQLRAILLDLNNPQLSCVDKEEQLEKMKILINSCWRTDELRRKPPSPTEEMRSNLSYVREVIFPAVPQFLRRLSKMAVKAGLPEYPLLKSPFKFSSWMGGDRDGNPNVTASVTREVVLTARIEAATMYIEEINNLMFDLSVWRATPEFLSLVELSAKRFLTQYGSSSAISNMRRARGYSSFFSVLPKNEPYRKLLAEVRDRLWDTRAALNACFVQGGDVPEALRPRPGGHDGLTGEDYQGPYNSKEELLQPLLAIHASLVATGDAILANGLLTDVIRQVNCFGLALTALDVRQESARHTDAMDAITQFLDLGSYASWDEADRVNFLERELVSKRPLIPPAIMMEVKDNNGPKSEAILTEEVREVLATFAAIAQLPLSSFGTYVISMAQAASDVLCVRLLQKEFGVPQPMLRVAPLFETLDDLKNAPASLRTLFNCEHYRQHHVAGLQEVMIGYSDSAKDAGRLAAAWAQYDTQEQLVAVAKDFGVDLVFFHGRGGTVGRGGGPVQLAVRSQPAGTIQKGAMRVTVQGEVIERQFGERVTACSTLDTYLSAMLEAELREPAIVKSEWRELMAEMQTTSCEAYRKVVFQDPRFVAYFREVTPSAELGRANIGSRPAKRKAVDSVASIRAIPWIFAWTQTRFNLPVWLGVGDAIVKVRKNPEQWKVLKDMYQNFIFFRTVVDLLEMVFAKSDPDIAKLYDAKLATSDDLKNMGKVLRENFIETQAAILDIAGHDKPLQGSRTAVNVPENCKERKMTGDARLKAHIDLRSIFITPLNLMQVRCLLETREAAKAGQSTAPVQDAAGMASRTGLGMIEDSLLITVKGIAAGLQNTG